MIYSLLLPLFCGLLNASSFDRINENNDHQIWSEEILERDLSEAWSYRLRALQYVGADYQRLYSHQYEMMVFYDLTKVFPSFLKSVTLGPGYYASEQIQSNTRGIRQWVWYNRLLVENSNTISIMDWGFSQRNRVEYHIYMRPNFEDHGVYRCRILITPPFFFTPLKIKPYISNEWFFRKDTLDDDNTFGRVGGWYQNRLRFGFTFVPYTLYWQWRILKQPPDRTPLWNNTYQIGFQINL